MILGCKCKISPYFSARAFPLAVWSLPSFLCVCNSFWIFQSLMKHQGGNERHGGTECSGPWSPQEISSAGQGGACSQRGGATMTTCTLSGPICPEAAVHIQSPDPWDLDSPFLPTLAPTSCVQAAAGAHGCGPGAGRLPVCKELKGIETNPSLPS